MLVHPLPSPVPNGFLNIFLCYPLLHPCVVSLLASLFHRGGEGGPGSPCSWAPQMQWTSAVVFLTYLMILFVSVTTFPGAENLVFVGTVGQKQQWGFGVFPETT